MPRLTAQQLQDAKRQKVAERDRGRLMAEQKDEWTKRAKERHAQLTSVVAGLYEEVDKLARKWPAMPVSDRTLQRTNKAISAVRELMANEGDDFLEDVNEIVSAGDMPENRDVVMTLRELKDALERLKERYAREWRDY